MATIQGPYKISGYLRVKNGMLSLDQGSASGTGSTGSRSPGPRNLGQDSFYNPGVRPRLKLEKSGTSGTKGQPVFAGSRKNPAPGRKIRKSGIRDLDSKLKNP